MLAWELDLLRGWVFFCDCGWRLARCGLGLLDDFLFALVRGTLALVSLGRWSRWWGWRGPTGTGQR